MPCWGRYLGTAFGYLHRGESVSQLLKMQFSFVQSIAKLILWTYERGYTLTFGESYNSAGTGHMKDSVHYIKLAQDFNVFKDGVWLDKGSEMEVVLGRMHDCWDTMGGARRIGNDLNHFSFEYQGRRLNE